MLSIRTSTRGCKPLWRKTRSSPTEAFLVMRYKNFSRKGTLNLKLIPGSWNVWQEETHGHIFLHRWKNFRQIFEQYLRFQMTCSPTDKMQNGSTEKECIRIIH